MMNWQCDSRRWPSSLASHLARVQLGLNSSDKAFESREAEVWPHMQPLIRKSPWPCGCCWHSGHKRTKKWLSKMSSQIKAESTYKLKDGSLPEGCCQLPVISSLGPDRMAWAGEMKCAKENSHLGRESVISQDVAELPTGGLTSCNLDFWLASVPPSHFRFWSLLTGMEWVSGGG